MRSGTSYTIPRSNYTLNVLSVGATTAQVRVMPTNRAPVGFVDTATATSTAITVTGWALDPDTTAPLTMHFYLDGTFAGTTTANTARPDIGTIFGLGANHGYTTTIPATTGTHRLCTYALDTTNGPNPDIGCRTLTVGGTR